MTNSTFLGFQQGLSVCVRIQQFSQTTYSSTKLNTRLSFHDAYLTRAMCIKKRERKEKSHQWQEKLSTLNVTLVARVLLIWMSDTINASRSVYSDNFVQDHYYAFVLFLPFFAWLTLAFILFMKASYSCGCSNAHSCLACFARCV